MKKPPLAGSYFAGEWLLIGAEMKRSHIIGAILVLLGIWAILIGECVVAGTIKGKVTATKAKYLPDAVVYVDSVAGKFDPPKEHLVMNQKNLVFIPRVLPLLAGTTVDFLNSDNVAHNVFSPDKSADKMNLGTWPKGQIKSFTFARRCDKVCDAVMLCNVHPEMEASVVILQNPFFAKADTTGTFQINNVPAGAYTLQVWHPKLKTDSQKIVVPETGAVQVEFSLKSK